MRIGTGLGWLLAATCVGAFGCGATGDEGGGPSGDAAVESAASAGVLDEMAAVRTSHRQTIVLMWDEQTLPEADRGLTVVVGRYLYENNLARVDALVERLRAELDDAGAGGFRRIPLLEAFLDEIESGAGWHDADKLCLSDAVRDLHDHLEGLRPESPVAKALLVRLDEDVKALDRIQALYDKELKQVFERLDTRGMEVTRERWDDYVAFLRGLHEAADIMASHRGEIGDAEPVSRSRGSAVSAPDAGTGPAAFVLPEIDGTELPDKTVILTFDDGPHSKHTRRILDILDTYGVKATFFQVGRSVGKKAKGDRIELRQRAAVTAEVVAAGHLVANHSFTHPVLTRLGEAATRDELGVTSSVLARAAESAPVLFRPPYGAVNKRVRKVAQEVGLRTVMWNLDSGDWSDPVPRSIANRAIAQVTRKGHGVIVFHDIHGRTVEALPLVLETLLDRGFRFALWDGERLVETAREAPASASTPRRSRLYGESHAVIIGINEYASWPRLNYAVSDARAMARLLIDQFGFDERKVHLLLDGDATRERIMALLGGTIADPSAVGPDDRVIVFFAGHGATRELPSGRSLGYIIPVDAGRDEYHGRAISMTTLQDINEACPAKHLLYVMDACYGGQALLRGGGGGHASDKYLKEITKRRARQVLTAGGPDEQVTDNGPGGHSIFTWTVLEGLRGKADLNGDQHVTATELFAHVGPVVSSLSHQTPAFGSLEGSEGGEVVFELATDDEFLTEVADQLDEEAIAINSRIDEMRRQIADKLARNDSLKAELAAVQAQLSALKVRGDDPDLPAKGDPHRAPKLRQLGMSLFREKRYEEAVAAYTESLELQPRNVLAANNLGFTYFAMGRLDEALEWYARTLEIDPERAVTYFNIGQVHEQRGDAAAAIAAYERFLELAPDHVLVPRVDKTLGKLRGDAAKGS